MTIKNLYPTSRPTLNLDFANTKSLDPRITFSRASSATYVDADGLIKSAAAGQARFDHSPTTGESLGLLVEEARTNLITFSEYPPRQNSSRMTYLSGPVIARPNGTFNLVNQITTDTVGSDSYIRFASNVAGGTPNATYAGSIWIRTATGTADINIKVNQAPLSYDGGGNTYTVTTNWQRITTVGSSNSTNLFIDLTTSSILPAGTVFYVWGAQLEQGSFPTSYIPTPATFTSRASTATYYDSAGVIQTAASGVARSNAFFPDSNGVMRPAGLLLEEAGTNLVTYSEQLGSAFWTAANVTRAVDTAIAPNGTLTADSILTGTGATTTSYVYQIVSLGVNSYTFSFYAKGSTSGQSAFIDVFPAGAAGATASRARGAINLSTGAVIYIQQDAGTSISAVNIGNGWWRCQVTFGVTVAGNLEVRVGNYLTGEIYLWGAQLETGSFPTSYIPTVASTVTRSADVSSSATVTRSADVASITGTNFSSWYRQDAGSIFTDFIGIEDGRASDYTTVGLAVTGNAVSTPALGFSASSTGGQLLGNYNGGALVNGSMPSTFTRLKLAMAMAQNSVAFSRNGAAPVTASSLTPRADTDRLLISPIGASGNGVPVNGTIARLTYYPVRLPDATLQALTV